MGVLWFALGSFLAMVIASGLGVYSAEHIEHAWGKGGSFQILCLLSAVAAFLLTVGFGLGAAISKRFPPRAVSAWSGVACAVLFVATLWVASLARANPAQSWALIVALPFIGAAAPLVHRRRDG